MQVSGEHSKETPSWLCQETFPCGCGQVSVCLRIRNLETHDSAPTIFLWIFVRKNLEKKGSFADWPREQICLLYMKTAMT